MNQTNVLKWYCKLNECKINTHDDQKSGKPSIVTDELLRKNKETVCEDYQLTVDKISYDRDSMSSLDLFYPK